MFFKRHHQWPQQTNNTLEKPSFKHRNKNYGMNINRLLKKYQLPDTLAFFTPKKAT